MIDKYVATFTVISPNEIDGQLALDLYRQFHLSHGLDWPDCQSAATAIRLGLKVCTQNLKHFSAFPGLRVGQAY